MTQLPHPADGFHPPEDLLDQFSFLLAGGIPRVARGRRGAHVGDQPVSIVEQQMPRVRELRLFAQAFSRELGVWIGRGLMRIVPPRFPVEVHGRVPRIVGRARRLCVLATEALETRRDARASQSSIICTNDINNVPRLGTLWFAVLPNALPLTIAAARLVTQSAGGNGAVRELPAQLQAARQET
jgi:hypothetical protein